jgi:hypothetical protein
VVGAQREPRPAGCRTLRLAAITTSRPPRGPIALGTSSEVQIDCTTAYTPFAISKPPPIKWARDPSVCDTSRPASRPTIGMPASNRPHASAMPTRSWRSTPETPIAIEAAKLLRPRDNATSSSATTAQAEAATQPCSSTMVPRARRDPVNLTACAARRLGVAPRPFGVSQVACGPRGTRRPTIAATTVTR